MIAGVGLVDHISLQALDALEALVLRSERGFLGLTLGTEMILLGLANFNRRRLAELAVARPHRVRPSNGHGLSVYNALGMAWVEWPGHGRGPNGQSPRGSQDRAWEGQSLLAVLHARGVRISRAAQGPRHVRVLADGSS